MGLVVVEDGEWEWQDGRRLGYTNWWDMGGSSGLGSESDEDSICVTVYMRTQRWRTKKCSKNNYYICEREFANATVTQPILAEDTTLADTRIPQSTTVMGDGRAAPPHSASNGDSTEHVCPDGFELFESSCYYLLSETLTDGYNSRNACAINVHPGSHLAFIESRSIQTFLKSLIMSRESTVDFWFGLTYTSDEDHLEWLDGRPLGNFTSWDRFGVFDEKSPCVRLRRRSDYSWNDRPCTGHEFGSVCEIEKTQAVTPTPSVTAPPAPSPQTKEAVFKASPSNMAAPTGSHHLQSMSALSLFRCATFCLRHNNCASFNYKSAEGRDKLSSFCELYSMHFPDEELSVKPGYRYYRV
ncbi:macrophage mannose receptor 1-like isoform X1 [Asterias amurensis]|uniref:macrophage mannose receptor 1-like isoform X1 n=1 Tax=Asterias amurensis TaxID=7602 RepID=UPI003AB8A4FE